jgi:UDP-N-acetylmuramoylalanine--D-glutamate ligase
LRSWPGSTSLQHFAGADLIVLSPGIARAKSRGCCLRACRWFPSWSWQLVRVRARHRGDRDQRQDHDHDADQPHPGENGKKVFTGGNIGTPLCEYLLGGEQADILVLEVSSFQLQNSPSFHPRVGVLLNFSANHLDYHETMEEYLSAKLSMFAHMDSQDLAVVPLSMKEDLEGRNFTAARRVYFVASSRFSCSGLPGEHNRENMEAAYLACRYFGLTEQDVQRGIDGFSSLPHRIEAVAEHRGVIFVDDSKSTTIDSMIAALKSQDCPVRLLAGGVFKGGDLGAVLPLIREKVRGVYLFGQSREIFEAAWADCGKDLSWDATLEEAVFRAASRPAAASACSCPRPRPVSICSPTTRSGARLFSARCVNGWRGVMKITQREVTRQLMNFDVILLGAVICLASLG